MYAPQNAPRQAHDRRGARGHRGGKEGYSLSWPWWFLPLIISKSILPPCAASAPPARAWKLPTWPPENC